LYNEFEKRGWQRKATARILFELSINVLLSLSGIVVFLAWDSLPVRACGMILSTAGSIGVGTNTHTSSHYATSDKRWVNEMLTYFGCTFFLGLSATYWWYKHLTVHHLAPNVVGVDKDADLLPWFAMTEPEVARGGRLRIFYYKKIQWIMFPFFLALNGFGMQLSGFTYLARALKSPHRRKRSHWIDMAALLLFFAAWAVAPMFYFPVLDVLAFYALRISLMGYAMFAVFAPSHLPSEAVRFSEDKRDLDRVFLQTATTLNFRTGPIGRLICSGLEYQIEHHLVPQFSHVYYPRMRPLIEEFCRERGLPYRTLQWDHALWKCWMVFRTPQPVNPDIKAGESQPANKA
jgi:fatty acid desaturase